MSEQLKAAYTNYRWMKAAAFLALIVCGALLFWLSGGFPPWAWRFLFQVLPQIPHLWQTQGSAILAPLIGLVLLSSALLIIWTAITISAIKVGLHWWHDFHEHQHFQMDMLEAERMADDVTISDQDDEPFTSFLGDDRQGLDQEDDIDILPTRPVARPPSAPRTRQPARQPMLINAPQLEQRFFSNQRPEQEERFSSNQGPEQEERFFSNGRPEREERRLNSNGGSEREERVQVQQARVQPSLRAASPSYPASLADREEQMQPSLRAASPSYPAPLDLPTGAQRRPKTERRVHIPPSASTSMRDQLRIVPPTPGRPQGIAPTIDVPQSPEKHWDQTRGKENDNGQKSPSLYSRGALDLPLSPQPTAQPLRSSGGSVRLYGDYDTLPGVPVLDEDVESEELRQDIVLPTQEEVESEELAPDIVLPAQEEVESEELEQSADELASSRPECRDGAGLRLGGGRNLEVPGEQAQQPSVELWRQVSPPPTGSAHRLVVGAGLDPGIARRKAPNEDNLCAIQGTRVTGRGTEPVGLFVVADGMGGHANGREASRMAIQSISELVVPVLLRTTDNSQEEGFDDLLKDAVHRANLAIYQRNRQQEHMMGTTMTGALIVDSTAYIANVGDSRTYLYRKSEGLSPLTRDHSIVARMVEDGIITADDIYTHPKRNQIYRCLGERASVEVDTFVVPLRAGDILLLCSDGLWEMVRDEDMRKIISSATTHPSQMSSMLIQAALSRGGADNVSVIVVYVAVA